MEILADIMLGIGAIGAAVYCMVLSRRLRRFNNLQNGMGGAVAVLSAQVDDMTTMLNSARDAAGESADILTDLTERAEASAQKLELMMASLHDLPDSDHMQAPEPHKTDAHQPHNFQQNMAQENELAPMFVSHRMMKAAE
ncbi:hypothetical protein SAMN05444851_0823 [Aliiroseovarius sediminilitoris]|uniref:Uncharacterized protein n=1 Tax=Aliiroseovarius sediminilitoris TaxID=1173584 RepID=A0A1I0NGS2_9RHOB|nr:hypothetical protein [Aliiroseovarius sediminilitoris]SEW00664.1 hypothetical protein SAMN05444851_0823 [Aliiroseovarius sediminilitoris]